MAFIPTPEQKSIKYKSLKYKSSACTKDMLSLCLADPFDKVLQVMTCGTQVQPSLVYSSQSNTRHVIKLSGLWQSRVRRILDETLSLDPQYPCHLQPEKEIIDLTGIDAWPSVLLKLQRSDEVDDEDTCHRRVNTLAPDIAPRFLFSFSIDIPHTHGVRVTFMEWLENCKTIYQLRRANPEMITPDLYVRTEAIVRDMWTRAGVLHCDLHPSNVLVSLNTGRPYIIDYGMAFVMEDAMRKKLCEVLENEGLSMIDAYKKVCKRHARHVIQQRGYNLEDSSGRIDDYDWNDDASLLDILHRYCFREKKKKQKQTKQTPLLSRASTCESCS